MYKNKRTAMEENIGNDSGMICILFLLFVKL